MKLREERACGSCTACCDGWLQIEVRGHRVRPGKPCPFSVEHQCSIYSERPQHPCREFCGWLTASSPLPEWMRPDKSDMIMLAANFLWHGLPVDVVVAAGARKFCQAALMSRAVASVAASWPRMKARRIGLITNSASNAAVALSATAITNTACQP
jgi:hypothetical protein